jgi:DNA-3-methyladenine glycosylase II
MATRRSARLSSINNASANDDTPKPQKPMKKETNPIKGPRKSIKRKTSDVKNEEENSKDETAEFSKRTPKRGKKDKRDGHPDDDTHMLKQLGIVATAIKPIRDNTPPPIERLANPHLSNAPLISPESSRLVANKALADASPSKPSAHPRITTTDILKKAIGHLVKTEPKLKPVIEKHHCHLFSPDGLAEVIDPFNSLASSIIAQQVSRVLIYSQLSRSSRKPENP